MPTRYQGLARISAYPTPLSETTTHETLARAVNTARATFSMG